jgi:hypothetical protein
MHNPVHRVRAPQAKQRRSGASLDGRPNHVARAHTRDTSGTRRAVDIVAAVLAALDARLAELSVHPLARLAREPFAIRLTHQCTVCGMIWPPLVGAYPTPPAPQPFVLGPSAPLSPGKVEIQNHGLTEDAVRRIVREEPQRAVADRTGKTDATS